MNGNEFLDKLELVNSKFIEEADIKPSVKKHATIKWVAAAACLCLVLTMGVFTADYLGLFNYKTNKDNSPEIIVEHAAAAGFSIDNNNNDIIYFPISFDECKRYGIIPEDAIGLSRDEAYEITTADIGEVMGTVTNCGDKRLVGKTVYHYSKFPNYDSICIVDTDKGYQFYTGTVFIGKYFDLSSNACLDMFDLPNSLEKIEIIDGEFKVLFEISDQNDISAIFDIISNKEDISNSEMNRRRAEAWYNEYGNYDVYYDEATGDIKYKYENEIIKEGYSYTTEDGTVITVEPQFGDTALRDQAAEFWSNNSHLISLICNNGFGITIDYEPLTATFGISNNRYSLNDEEVQKLNSILQIAQ